jgi:GTP-binding protein
MAQNPHVKRVEFIKSAVHPADYPVSELPEIAIAGRSNVGKSSLLNKLVNRRRLAKVSSTPGRTQLLNFFQVNDAFVVCDLPGYGYAKVPLAVKKTWGKMIETYLEQREPLRGLMLLMDVRRDPAEWERNLIAFCSANGRTILPVVTKVDKLPPSKRSLAIQRVAGGLGLTASQVVGWSATTGEGLELLWRRTIRLAGLDTPAPPIDTPPPAPTPPPDGTPPA